MKIRTRRPPSADGKCGSCPHLQGIKSNGKCGTCDPLEGIKANGKCGTCPIGEGILDSGKCGKCEEGLKVLEKTGKCGELIMNAKNSFKEYSLMTPLYVNEK